jgi:Asp-tRNA(Asn)/Glu-tRNA(Gln) amidotransferase A subunit family amidase
MGPQLYQEPLAETLEKLQTGEMTVTEYLNQLRDRVKEIEPEIESLVEDPDWDRLKVQSTELADPEKLPLYGIPIGVKDVIRTDDLPTKANSEVPAEALAGPEASCVTRLREAGCLVFTKTVTTQFAFSTVGSTHNPHNLDHTSGGSSSGSAAAVAAGLCPLALGTQTGGSTLRPAAFCGIVGFKSTFQRIPTDSVIQVSASLDHVGVYTQDVAGMREAAAVMCDDWNNNVVTPEEPTLGVPTGPYLDQIREEGAKAFDAHLNALETAGYEITKVDLFDDIEEQKDRHRTLSRAEAALAHHDRFESYADGYSEELVERIELGRSETVEALACSREYQRELTDTIEETMENQGIDVWICPPALGTAPEGVDYTGDASMNRPWTMAGMPAMSLPGGSVDGLPVGLQIIAATGADEHLLNWSEEIAPVVANSI